MNAYRSILLAIVFTTGAFGCQAYSNAANGVLNSGLVNVVDGSVPVKNALSVPVCKITVFSDKDPDRTGNDLETGGKALAPGADSHATIPHFGKGSDPTPEGMKYGMKVYACKDRTAYTQEPGALITTIPSIDSKSSQPIIIH